MGLCYEVRLPVDSDSESALGRQPWGLASDESHIAIGRSRTTRGFEYAICVSPPSALATSKFTGHLTRLRASFPHPEGCCKGSGPA